MLGAAALLWPALVNGYPILFSDTHAFLVQADVPRMIWDKPFAYGPFLRLLHGGATLWLPAAAQALIVSHMLWLSRSAITAPSLLWHVSISAVLAGLTTCAWFTSLLMPDIFAPLVVLSLFLLGFDDRVDRSSRLWIRVVATVAIVVHLSHLVIAAACILAVLFLRPSRVPAVLGPLVVAVILLIASNLIGFHRFAVSPFGSVFMLSRLSADGLVVDTLERECPKAGWRMCGWTARLPTDSDEFMWNERGPVWTTPGGPQVLAREAGEIVTATVLAEPLAVAKAMAGNTVRQLGMFALGDTLRSTWLEGSVTNSLREFFPRIELARFYASLQSTDKLEAVASQLALPILLVLGAGAAGLLVMLGGLAIHGRSPAGGLAVMVLVGLLANAFATGALAKPHDRYQARIIWLVVAAPLLAALPGRRSG